jgi:hypothetical protein
MPSTPIEEESSGEDRPPCHFMRLPPELRLLIYEYCLNDRKLCWMRLLGNQRLFKLFRKHLEHRSDPMEPTRHTTAILQTSREIYAESRPILFTTTTAWVGNMSAPEELQQFMDARFLRPDWVPVEFEGTFFAIRGDLTINFETAWSAYAGMYAERFFEALGGCKIVRTLTIELPPPFKKIFHPSGDHWAAMKGTAELHGVLRAIRKIEFGGSVQLEFEPGGLLPEGEAAREMLRQALRKWVAVSFPLILARSPWKIGAN